MFKIIPFMRNLIVVLAFCLACLLGVNELYFFNLHPFVSPLEIRAPLIIRNDSYGDGYFRARRSGGRPHTGIDLAAPIGTSVRSVKSGWVVVCRNSRGSGNFIEIYHKKGMVTVYAHLDTIKVRLLQRVKQGEVIGTVGKTGNANYKKMQAHLHFEIIQDGRRQDPLAWLPGIKTQSRPVINNVQQKRSTKAR